MHFTANRKPVICQILTGFENLYVLFFKRFDALHAKLHCSFLRTIHQRTAIQKLGVLITQL